MTKLLDSNILIYFLQEDAGKRHQIAKSLIDELTKNRQMAISIQNLAETARVILEKSTTHKFDEDELSNRLIDLADFSLVLPYSASTVSQAIKLHNKYKIHFFDALLAATMQENSIDEILTENTIDFGKIPGLKVHNPFIGHETTPSPNILTGSKTQKRPPQL